MPTMLKLINHAPLIASIHFWTAQTLVSVCVCVCEVCVRCVCVCVCVCEVCVTRKRQHGLELLAVCDAGACLGTRLPQVLIVPHRRDQLIRKRRRAPRIIQQRNEGEQPASQTHQKPQQLNRSRHDQLTRLKSTQYPINSQLQQRTDFTPTRAPYQDGSVFDCVSVL